MSKKLYEEANISDIADAIREKNGTQNQYTVAQMPSAVRGIKAQPDLESLTAIENGNYLPSAGKDGFSSVTVNVESSEPVVQPLSVTQNGTYNPPSGVDGYAPVTVNVSGGGSDDWTSLTNYIESSGTQYINSGYSPTANTKFEVIADVPDNTTLYPALIGERNTPLNEVVIFAEFNNYNLGLIWANGDNYSTSDNVRQYYIGQKCKYILSSDGFRCALNANGYGFLSEKTIGSNFAKLPIFIFALNSEGSPDSTTFCSAKLYRFRIYENDVMIHEFIPWQENGVACLKDTVTSEIKYNAGTGDFVYGTDA